MADDPLESGKWRRFQRLKLNRKGAIKRIRKAEAATVKHAHRFILKRWKNVKEVRRTIAVWSLAIGCLIAAAALQMIWSQGDFQQSARADGGTYAEAVLGPVDTLNPVYAVSSAEYAVSKLVFSRIMTYDSSGSLNYDLASDVEREGDSVVRVTLRDDAHWHDGRKLTSADVVFTAELLQNQSVRSPIRGWSSMEIEAIDDTTVVFTLPGPSAAFNDALTFPILPKHILEGVDPASLRENEYSVNPIGSGPFQLRSVQLEDTTGQRRIIHLAANESYYKQAPRLDRLNLYVYPDRESIKQALQLNEVNAAANLTYADIQSLNEERYHVSYNTTQSGVYALLNTESEVLSDRAVRRALQRATSVEDIQQKVGGGVAGLNLPFTNGQFGDETPKRAAYDVEAARKILDDAGWKEEEDGVRTKGGRELRLAVVTTSGSAYERTLEALVGQWRKIGVVIDERVIDTSDATQNFAQTVLQPRNYDVLLYQLEIGRDPDVYAYWHSSQATARGLNFSNYSNELADDNLSTARTTYDLELREAKYVAFARQWLSDVPAIGLYQPTSPYVSTGESYTGLDRMKLISESDRYGGVSQWTVRTEPVYKTP